MLNEALRLLDLGLRPIPVAGKRPLIPWRPYLDRAPTAEEVEQWFSDPRADGIAIICNHPGGVFAIDVDLLPDPETKTPKTKPNPWPGSPDKPLNPGAVLETPSGGRQYFWAAVDGLASSVGKLAPGVDVRATGSITIVYGPGRRFVYGSLEEALQTPPPAWLLEELTDTKPAGGIRIGDFTVERPEDVLAGVPEGMRDDALFRYACRLRAKRYSADAALSLVLAAARNCIPPFPPEEARRKVESAWRYSPNLAAIIADVGEAQGEIPPPSVRSIGPVHRVSFNGLNLSFLVHVIDGSKGECSARVKLEMDSRIMDLGITNLARPRSRAEFAKHLAEVFPKEIATKLVDALWTAVADASKGTFVPVTLTPVCSTEVSWLVQDLILANQLVLFFGKQSSGKTWIALEVGTAVAEGQPVFGSLPVRQGPVLYLDWESGGNIMGRRLAMLGRNPQEFYYVECKAPYQAIALDIINAVAKLNPVLIIVDSLVRAVHGLGKSEADPIIDFYQFLSELPGAKLCIHHPRKDEDDSPWGTGVHLWYPRLIWHVMADSLPDATITRIYIVNEKFSEGRKLPPITIQLVNEGAQVKLQKVVEVGAMARGRGGPISANLTHRILEVVLANPGRLTRELAALAGTETDVARVILNRLAKEGKVRAEAAEQGTRWWPSEELVAEDVQEEEVPF